MSLSKTHLDYWLDKVAKRSDKSSDGSVYESSDYYIRLWIGDKAVRFNLNTANQRVAANKAKEIWLYYQNHGADATIKKYKDSSKKKVKSTNSSTVGDYIEEINQLGLIKQQTIEIYFRKFRTLVAGVAGISSTNKKCDYVNGGYEKWKAKVESVPLESLTAEKIQRWMGKYTRAAGDDPVSQRKAKTTLNSLVRNSKSLFSSKLTKHLPFSVKSPFDDVTMFPKQKRRYNSRFDAATLAEAAHEQLNITVEELEIEPGEKGYGKAKLEREKDLSKPEQFKILLLALGAGLRKDEIDTLKVTQLNFDDNTILLENDNVTELKSEESAGVIDVDSNTMAVLKKLLKSGQFYVIESNVAPRTGTRYHHYRCERHFKGLIAWLREQGIEDRNAIHTLRKEFGSELCKRYGIFMASHMLRHSNISLTRESYVDKKERAAVALFS